MVDEDIREPQPSARVRFSTRPSGSSPSTGSMARRCNKWRTLWGCENPRCCTVFGARGAGESVIEELAHWQETLPAS